MEPRMNANFQILLVKQRVRKIDGITLTTATDFTPSTYTETLRWTYLHRGTHNA